ncbi:hypothetical protein VTK56DRAFT_5442 [Thermocarpiscus australiensis]
MASLRFKFEKTFHKWNGMLKPSKRRIAEEDEAPQQPKQLRTIADPAPALSQTPSQQAQASPALPTPPFGLSPSSNPSSSTFAASETMNYYPFDGINDLFGTVADTIGTPGRPSSGATNPPNLMPTGWHASAGSVIQSPLDHFLHSVCGTIKLDPLFHHSGRLTLGPAAAIVDGRLLVGPLQQQFGHQHVAPAAPPSFPHEAIVCPDALGANGSLTVYRERLKSLRCANCSTSISIDAAALIQDTKKMLKESGLLHPLLRCSKCKTWTCVGGDTYCVVVNPPLLSHHVSRKNVKITWCCDEGRGFLTFLLLCGIEFSVPLTSATIKKTRGRSKSEAQSATASPQQTPQKSGSKPKQPLLSKGTGYGGDIFPPDHKRTVGRRNDNSSDLELYFRALSLLLPAMTQGRLTPFDHSRQPTLAAMIPRSPMLHHASELLRYAVISEISGRCGPVTAVLDFVEAMANHPDTAPFVFRERTLFPLAEQLPHLLSGLAPNVSGAGTARYETAQPLSAIIEQLAIPCRIFAKTSRRVGSIDAANEQELLAVVKRILNLADLFGANGSRQTSEPVKSPSSSLGYTLTATIRGKSLKSAQLSADEALRNIAKETSAWHRAHCVSEVPDLNVLEGFYFAKQAIAAETERPYPGRMRKLLAQIASLSTDLPEGIYVRFGEGRPDVLKVLIIGPGDTPYENGLFEFDMFCDASFPGTPPKMYFRTTGGGVASFNPNLYPDGKICLSLLGTWPGQPWEPDRSTILQILVSIQAMIFNSQPYYNEPGYENRAEPERAETYNRRIEAQTLQYALVDWLETRLAKPLKETGTSATAGLPLLAANGKSAVGTAAKGRDDFIWGSVIRKHFELKAGIIMSTVRKWETKAPSHSPMNRLIPRLEYGLREQGFHY